MYWNVLFIIIIYYHIRVFTLFSYSDCRSVEVIDYIGFALMNPVTGSRQNVEFISHASLTLSLDHVHYFITQLTVQQKQYIARGQKPTDSPLTVGYFFIFYSFVLFFWVIIQPVYIRCTQKYGVTLSAFQRTSSHINITCYNTRRLEVITSHAWRASSIHVPHQKNIIIYQHTRIIQRRRTRMIVFDPPLRF